MNYGAGILAPPGVDCKTPPKCDWIGIFEIGAGDGNRTRVASLEGWNSTIELHPQPGIILRLKDALSIGSMSFGTTNAEKGTQGA